VRPSEVVERFNRRSPRRSGTILPRDRASAATAGGRPAKADRKANEMLRLDPDVLDAYRQEGPGWRHAVGVVPHGIFDRCQCFFWDLVRQSGLSCA
jgi:hypothetical protein